MLVLVLVVAVIKWPKKNEREGKETNCPSNGTVTSTLKAMIGEDDQPANCCSPPVGKVVAIECHRRQSRLAAVEAAAGQ